MSTGRAPLDDAVSAAATRLSSDRLEGQRLLCPFDQRAPRDLLQPSRLRADTASRTPSRASASATASPIPALAR